MDTIKNYNTIHSQLNQANLLESYNSHDDLSNRVCVPNKTENLNIHVFNLITGKNESKISTKDILCD